MFGKTFPEDDKEKENKENENGKEEIELRFDKYVKLKEYKTSYENVN